MVRYSESAKIALDQAKALVLEDDARFSEVEIICTEGHMHLLQENRQNAKQCFEQAIERAAELGHLTSQLNAAVALFDLMQQDGQEEQARKRLAAIYDQFEEGDSFPALLDAQARLGNGE